MHYSLAHLEESFHVNNTYKVLSMAPCFVVPAYGSNAQSYSNTYGRTDELEFYAYNGPNWEADKKRVCAALDVAFCLELNGWISFGESVKTLKHWNQSSIAG